jgi:cytochrome c oxidase cbb3-type subunit 3
MPAYEQRIPPLVLWEITAYVRKLPDTKPDQRRRQDLDQNGEPQGDHWSGPMR